MKKTISVVLSVLITMSCLIIIGSAEVGATQNRTGNFSRNYSITGNGAEDIVNVARAQLGKTGSQLGYSEQWCADFVSDCAILANQSAAVPAAGYCPTLRQNIINAGGYYVNINTAQTGDIVFYGNNGADHVEIVYAASNGNVSTYGGNSGSGGSLYARSVRQHATQTQSIAYIVRPNYRGSGCNCSDSYAGDYVVTTNSLPLTMRSGHGTGYSAIASIPKDSVVYVSKSDGSWAHVNWEGHEGYCSMQYLTRKTDYNPGPTGYNISISSTSFYESEVQTVTVTPFDSNISNYKLHFIAPNGATSDQDLGDKNYLRFACRGVYGTWKVYAEVSNSGGTYRGATDNGCLSFTIQQLKWNTNGTDLGSDFYAQIGSAVSSGKVLTHESLQSEYTNVYMSTNQNTNNQIFRFVRQSDGCYKIYSRRNTNYCLDVRGDSFVNCTNVGVYETNDSNAQKWRLHYAGNGYYRFRPEGCNSAILDVDGASPDEGTNVQLYTYNGTDAQLFSIEKMTSATIDVDKSSLTLDLAKNPSATVTVIAKGLLPTTYSFSCSRNTDVFETKWGSWDGNTSPYTITAKKTGSYTLDFKLLDKTSGETVIATKTINVTVNCSHKYSTKTISPTCTEKGYTLHTCSLCGNSYKDNYTDAKSHSYGSWTVTKEATCTASGVKTRTCSNCGNKETQTISATGHSYGSWTTTKAATCTASGTKTRTCSKCGNKETQTIAATGHKYTTSVIAPTSTEKGYTLHKCSACGDSYKDNYTNPINPVNPNSAQIVVDNKTASLGSKVSVDISLKNNPGIVGMTLDVEFNQSVLKLVNVSDKGVLGANSHKPELRSPYTLSWSNDTSTTNYIVNGSIVTLTFEVAQNAAEETYPIVVKYNYDNMDIYNKDLDKVKFEISNGSVKVSKTICGDVNSDGTVNNLDRVYITRYLAKWDDYQDINKANSDVNNDGSVNNIDKVILTRHLAKWEAYSTLPYTS
ncbi:MAG: RICIN domain-containing protein [Ruminococcus sp.]|nr:RICIN domain-containing protein [Ruminococcus sp.]